MSFNVSADAYDRFMGRYSEPLAARFVEWVQVREGQQALDVGCGPGAMTAQLVSRLGSGAVAAVDPSAPFVAALHSRFPEVDVRSAAAEELPFADDTFDVAVAELVVHFMSDPVAGLREMGRVVRRGGTVAACVWDHSGGGSPLSLFWQAACALDPEAPDEAELAGTREGQLAELSEAAGLKHVEPGLLSVRVPFSTFDAWWEPFMLGVGPAGSYTAQLDADRQEALRSACAARLPEPPFEVVASAWSVRSRA